MSVSETVESHHAEMARMKQRAPEIARAFGSMFAPLMKAGALTALEKELIALGIGIAMRCEPCIWSHVEKCLSLGATPEQIIETAGVAVVMQGGPAYTYVAKVIQVLEQLRPAAAAEA